MRQFFVYGFRSRDEFDAKSARSYDNEKRRVESWLVEYMSFRQDANGKAVFLSVDSRHIAKNPLHKAWKASSFTKNDISLHFLILDILDDNKALNIFEILDCIDTEYLPAFQNALPIDESTLRKKLKEYTNIGLVIAEKQGKQIVYRLPKQTVNISSWQNTVSFFSEDNPLGVIGSYLLDNLDDAENFFTFKHRYLLFSLDSDIMLSLLKAINMQKSVELELAGSLTNRAQRNEVVPVKIFISTQGGRQYLAAYKIQTKRLCFFRLDSIQKVTLVKTIDNYSTFAEYLKEAMPHLWGVATGVGRIEHIEMTLKILPEDMHIVHRLNREKRIGTVEQLNETTWRFSADVYDSQELLPWLRTFIGRIISLTCTNPKIEQRFWADLSTINHMYGGDSNAI
jgi:hypothetical protein